jgi:hypothetical protein
LPVQAADDSDLFTALEAVRTHRLAFWDALLWASAQRAGIRHLLTEDFEDGSVLQDITDRKAPAATLTGSCGSGRTRGGQHGVCFEPPIAMSMPLWRGEWESR